MDASAVFPFQVRPVGHLVRRQAKGGQSFQAVRGSTSFALNRTYDTPTSW